MRFLAKIVGVNLLFILVYSILIRLIAGRQESMAILALSAVAVGGHVIICLIVSAIEFGSKKKELGKAWLLSAGIVLLVGFSVCLGNASLR